MKSDLIILLVAIAILIGVLQPTYLQAQTAAIKTDSTKEDGLKVTKFETPYGNLVVNLPDDMADSDTISGTVIAEPKGETEEEKNTNSDTLEGFVVEVVPKKAPERKASCKQRSDCRPFCLSIPNLCDAVDIVVYRIDGSEGQSAPQPVARSIVTCLPAPPPMHLPPDKAVLPTKGNCGKPMVIKGKCDGKFGNSAVYVGKKPCRMLAESPRKQVAQSPKDLTGKLTIESVEGARRVFGMFENLPIVASMQSAPVSTPKATEDTQYMTMRTPPAQPPRKAIDLSGMWTVIAKNNYGAQTVSTRLTQNGNQVTWRTSGDNWSVDYKGILSGNALYTTQNDGNGKFTGQGVLTYDESADTLSGTLNFVFPSGSPQGVTADLVMQRTAK